MSSSASSSAATPSSSGPEGVVTAGAVTASENVLPNNNCTAGGSETPGAKSEETGASSELGTTSNRDEGDAGGYVEPRAQPETAPTVSGGGRFAAELVLPPGWVWPAGFNAAAVQAFVGEALTDSLSEAVDLAARQTGLSRGFLLDALTAAVTPIVQNVLWSILQAARQTAAGLRPASASKQPGELDAKPDCE